MLADQKKMLFYVFKGFYFHLLFRYVCHALSCIPLKGIYIQLDSKGNVLLSMPEILSVSINNNILPSWKNGTIIFPSWLYMKSAK